MIKIVFVTSLVTCLAANILVVTSAFADDAPDAHIEKRLDEKYSGQALTPTDEGDWLMVSGQTPHKTYITKHKESLKDISELLFGDPHFWTKLWSINKNVTNPYEVPAGTVISVTEASEDLPPSFGVAFEAVRTPEDMGQVAGPDILGYTLNVEVPASSHDRASALDEIPSTLPNWQFRRDRSFVTKMETDRPIRTVPMAVKNLDYFVLESMPDGDGEIVGTEMNLKSAGEYQYVYVHFSTPPRGKNFTVIKNGGEVETEFVDSKPVLVQVLGSVEVLDPVDKENGTYRALVRKALDNVQIGAKLIAGAMPTYEFTINDPPSAAKATIIGGHFSTSRHLFGTESVVFLDHGNKEGLVAGQALPIYQFQRSKLDGQFVKENPLLIGHLKVVKTSDHFSTAVVVDSSDTIEVGDGTSPDLKRN